MAISLFAANAIIISVGIMIGTQRNAFNMMMIK